jgi:predicted AAA+ superfamily ATPase
MSDIAKISHVFDSLPTQLSRENKKFVFQLVRNGARAREYEDAIQWLVNAGLVHQIWLISKPALPLIAYDQFNAFKLYGMDVGIIRKMSNLSPIVFGEGDRLFTEFKGALTENYILQSLITQFPEKPHYWTSGNIAEIDFVITHENQIIPMEVKSDMNIKSRSLTLYRTKFQPSLSIRYSLRNLEFRDGLLNIPLYMADYTKELIEII